MLKSAEDAVTALKAKVPPWGVEGCGRGLESKCSKIWTRSKIC